MGQELMHPNIVKTIKCVVRAPQPQASQRTRATISTSSDTASKTTTTTGTTGNLTATDSTKAVAMMQAHKLASCSGGGGGVFQACGGGSESSSNSTVAGPSTAESSNPSAGHGGDVNSPHMSPNMHSRPRAMMNSGSPGHSPHPATFSDFASADYLAQCSNSHAFQSSYDSNSDMGETWLVMEFCDQGTLQDALDKNLLRAKLASGEYGPDLPVIVHTAWEVASALHYLHSQGIIHGDLTAWNIMLSSVAGTVSSGSEPGRSNFIAKVADFGLSRSMDTRSKIKTRTYGTITHMPPEVRGGSV